VVLRRRWGKPEATKLNVKELNEKNLTVESALYASSGHRGELTRTR
jgi:hypothetical protein